MKDGLVANWKPNGHRSLTNRSQISTMSTYGDNGFSTATSRLPLLN